MADRDRKGRQARAERSGPRLHPETFRGERNGRAKLTEADVLQIIAAYKAGALQKNLAARYGVTDVAISKAISGKNWRHLRAHANAL